MQTEPWIDVCGMLRAVAAAERGLLRRYAAALGEGLPKSLRVAVSECMQGAAEAACAALEEEKTLFGEEFSFDGFRAQMLCKSLEKMQKELKKHKG